jgi:type I restriction enzyme R subunit
VLIDQQLEAADWIVQDGRELNLFAGPGIAVREVVMARGHGRADYLLYLDKRVAGVIEAKPEGSTLSGVEWQSAMYATGLPEAHRKRAITVADRLPFVFEASGSEKPAGETESKHHTVTTVFAGKCASVTAYR